MRFIADLREDCGADAEGRGPLVHHEKERRRD